MIELVCYWCLATVMDGHFTVIGKCGQGTQDKMLEVSRQETVGAGQMFMTECVKPGEKPQITWNDKQGGFFMQHR